MKIRSVLFAGALLALSSSASAEWHEARSKHFIVYADEKPSVLKEFAQRLEKFDAAVRIVRQTDDPPTGDGLKLTVYVLDSSTDVSRLAVGKRSTIAGFYIPRATGSVAFVPRRTGSSGSFDSDAVFFHEYAHHLMFQNMQGSYPGWLVEGFAEFFSRPEFMKDGAVRLGTPAEHRAAMIAYLGKPRIEDLIGETLDLDSEDETEKLYGRGWLLTHYLTFASDRAGQLGRYLSAISQGKTPLEAGQSAFGDLRALDRELDFYWRANKYAHLNVSSPVLEANAATVQVRPLSAGEAAMIPIRMRSHRGVNKETAPEVAAEARRVGASYPRDPFVQRALAEAEYDAGNFGAARLAADRALALNPNYVEALLYKGRAMIAEADESGQSADWNAIRTLFMQANRLDREDPEPLLLFYRSFGAAGTAATENAVEGLLYAQLLAPHDSGLRYSAAAELVSRDRMAEAIQALQPLLMLPHESEKQRDHVRELLSAMRANDKSGALKLLGSYEDDGTDGEGEASE